MRADAILAAAGAGIAGLYASLWASTSLYGFFGDAVALPLAAAIAAVAVAVAIRVKQEPLAVFGVGAAMVAPVLVTHHVTAGGVLFTRSWPRPRCHLLAESAGRTCSVAAWRSPGLRPPAALAVSQSHTGTSLAVLDVELVAGLIVGMLFVVELRRPTRAPRSRLWAGRWRRRPSRSRSRACSSSRAAAICAGTPRRASACSGSRPRGLPSRRCRPCCAGSHADLTDILGRVQPDLDRRGDRPPARAAPEWCALGRRVADAGRRGRADHRRGAAAARRLNSPLPSTWLLAVIGRSADRSDADYDHLPALGAGSAAGASRWQGSHSPAAGSASASLDPGAARLCCGSFPAARGRLRPAWSLHAEWAVSPTPCLAAAVFVYRRTPYMVSWLPTLAAIVTGAALWAAGALVALSSPRRSRARQTRAGTASAPIRGSPAWWRCSPRRSSSPGRSPAGCGGRRYLSCCRSSTLAYLIVQASPAPYAIWAWLGVAAAAGIAMHCRRFAGASARSPLLAVPPARCSARA